MVNNKRLSHASPSPHEFYMRSIRFAPQSVESQRASERLLLRATVPPLSALGLGSRVNYSPTTTSY